MLTPNLGSIKNAIEIRTIPISTIGKIEAVLTFESTSIISSASCFFENNFEMSNPAATATIKMISILRITSLHI